MKNVEVHSRNFKGIWIPASLWLMPGLSANETVLAAEIDSLDGEFGCIATNRYFCEFLKIKSEETISRMIKKLKTLGLVYQESYNGRRRVLRSRLDEKVKSDLTKKSSQTCRKSQVRLDEKVKSGRLYNIIYNKVDNKEYRAEDFFVNLEASLSTRIAECFDVVFIEMDKSGKFFSGIEKNFLKFISYLNEQHNFKFKSLEAVRSWVKEFHRLSGGDSGKAIKILETAQAKGWKNIEYAANAVHSIGSKDISAKSWEAFEPGIGKETPTGAKCIGKQLDSVWNLNDGTYLKPWKGRWLHVDGRGDSIK